MLALCSGLFSSSHEPQDLTTLQAWRQQLYCRRTGKFAIFKGNGGQDITMSSSSFLGLKSGTHFNLPFPPVVFLKPSCPLSLRLVAPMFGDDDEAMWQSKVLASLQLEKRERRTDGGPNGPSEVVSLVSRLHFLGPNS